MATIEIRGIVHSRRRNSKGRRRVARERDREREKEKERETKKIKNDTTCPGCQLFRVVYTEQSHKREPCIRVRVAFGKAVNGRYLRNTTDSWASLNTTTMIEMELCLRTVPLDGEAASSWLIPTLFFFVRQIHHNDML